MIRKARTEDLGTLAALAALLWPHHTPEELAEEFGGILAKKDAAFFIGYEAGEAVGFAQCQLRRDYVEGTEHSPAGYLEGIFVKEGYRRKGWAKRLLRECERWAAGQGCAEFASDCELHNEESRLFHLRMGFTEAARIICFAKKL